MAVTVDDVNGPEAGWIAGVATALQRSVTAHLASAIADDDLAPAEQLFLAAKARPPLVVWRPEPAMLRAPVLVRLLEAWRRLPRSGCDIPPLSTAPALARGGDGEWTMLLQPPASRRKSAQPLDRFVHRHYGAGIARHCGRDLRGQTLAAFPDPERTFVAAVYEAVRLRPEPVFTAHEPPAAMLVRSLRQLILPFASPAGDVGGFVVGTLPESAFGTLLDVMHDAALVTDSAGRVRLANRAAAALLGHAGQPFVGAALDDHLPGLTRAMQRLAEAVDGVGALGHHELALGSGRRRRRLEVSIGGSLIAGEPLFVLVLRDLTERARREQALETIAFRDELTGVLNRRGLRQRRGAERRRGRRRQDAFGLLIIDLDGFKALNDKHGHAAGDAVLAGVAGRLASALRGDDAVARWGGDEFVVVLPGIAEADELAAAAAKLLAALAAPHLVDGQPLNVSVSVGGASYPRHGADFDAVLAAADKALYAAKTAGGSRLQLAPGPAAAGA